LDSPSIFVTIQIPFVTASFCLSQFSWHLSQSTCYVFYSENQQPIFAAVSFLTCLGRTEFINP